MLVAAAAALFTLGTYSLETNTYVLYITGWVPGPSMFKWSGICEKPKAKLCLVDCVVLYYIVCGSTSPHPRAPYVLLLSAVCDNGNSIKMWKMACGYYF